MGLKQVRLFEFTRTFHPNAEADNGLCRTPCGVGIDPWKSSRPSWADRSPAAVLVLERVGGRTVHCIGCSSSTEYRGSRLGSHRKPASSLPPRGHPSWRHAGGCSGRGRSARALAMGLKKARPCYFGLMSINWKRHRVSMDLWPLLLDHYRPAVCF